MPFEHRNIMDREKVLDIVMKAINHYYDLKLIDISRREYERVTENPDGKTVIKQLMVDGINELNEVKQYVQENLK